MSFHFIVENKTDIIFNFWSETVELSLNFEHICEGQGRMQVLSNKR